MPPPGAGQELALATLVGTFTGSATAVYPQMNFIAKILWGFNVWVTQIEFSTSITLYPVDTLGGLAIIYGKADPVLAVDPGLQSVIVHQTAPNSIAGPPAFALPSSKVSPIAFGGCGLFIPASTPLSLYGFGNTSGSGNYMAAVASIQYRRAA